jgi:dTMP kinase
MPDADPQDPQNPQNPQNPPTGYFTKADLDEAVKAAKEKARTEEREKLYPQIQASKDQLGELTGQVKTLTEAEQEREKARLKAERDAEKARKAAEDAELTAAQRLEKRQTEMQEQFDRARQEQEAALADMQRQRELDQAFFKKERELADLQIYIRDRVAQESEHIAPELLDFITGNSAEEVDASIQRVKDKTAQIVEGMRQAGIAQRAGMPGTAPSAGATGLTPGIDTGNGVVTKEDIEGMDMAQFAALRQRVGMGQAGQGIFR